LYTLKQSQLAKILFPIGDIHKPELRDLASRSGFDNHQKKTAPEFVLLANASSLNS